MERLLVSKIQRFSVDDGPGIRTTVFLKGCNLNCRWCHNPESISSGLNIEYQPECCVGCKACSRLCGCHQFTPEHGFERTSCKRCGRCADACVYGAIKSVGQLMSSDEILEVVLRDAIFYETSDGGVTFSGGEPLLQAEALRKLLPMCKKSQLHTVIDTAGNLPWQAFEGVMEYTDLFLFDIKLITDELHLQWTGTSNKRILENVRRLCELKQKMWIRISVIPGVNCGEEMNEIAHFVAGLPSVERIELLPYHAYGEGKYALFGLENKMDCQPPDDAFMAEQREYFTSLGLDVT